MKSYINDYKINVIEIKKNNLNLQNKNNIDLFKVMSIVYDMNKDRQERKQLLSYKMSRPNVQKILYKNVQLVCLS